MILDPVRLFRRWRRVEREALEEAQMLRRRYGSKAQTAALEKLSRDDLSTWHRQVMKRASKLLDGREL